MNFPTRITGIDGKSYPARWLSQEERDFFHGRTHYLAHDESMSVRKIRDYWLYNHKLQRSVGAIARVLAMPCTECSGAGNHAPEHLAESGAA